MGFENSREKQLYLLDFDLRWAKSQRELDSLISENVEIMDRACWASAIRNQFFCEKLIERYQEYLPWKGIALQYKNLPEEYLDKYFDDIDWFDISCFQVYSKDFIKRHYYQLSLNKVITNERLPKDVLEYARKIYDMAKDKPEFHKRWDENLRKNKTFCPRDFKGKYSDYTEKTEFPNMKSLNLNGLGDKKQKIIEKKIDSKLLEKYQNMSKSELKTILSKRNVRVYYHDTLEILRNKCVESEGK